MNRLWNTLALGTALIASASFASASTAYIGSYGTPVEGATNPGFYNTATYFAPLQPAAPAGNFATGSMYGLSQGTYNLQNTSPTWTGPLSIDGMASSYISINPGDGPGGATMEPNGTYGYHSYFYTPSVGTVFGGSISVLADDTVDVFLNGTQIIFDSTGNNGGYPNCSLNAPNCITASTANFLSSYFRTDGGPNDLFFEVIQGGHYATGLDFVGTVTATPEPSTLMLLGTGLVGSAGALLRRMRS